MRRPGPPAHETASAVPPVRRLSLPAHEAASAVPPVRRLSPPAHEAASAAPPVRRLSPPAHEAASAVPPVRSPGLPAHEEDQNKAFVRERVTFAHGRIVEPFSVARKDCGTLTGCVMALLSLARGVPFVLADRNRR